MKLLRSLLRLLVRGLYGFRVYNPEILRTPGPVLLIPNHVSWIDWLLLWVCLEDDWKFVTSEATSRLSWVHRAIMANHQTFPIDPFSPFAVKRLTEYLQSGGRMVLFAEGRISLTGRLMKLFDGTGFLLLRSHARLITCYLRGAERLPWVRHDGWTKFFPRVSAHFSDLHAVPNCDGLSGLKARKKVTEWLMDRMTEQQFDVEMEFGPKSPLGAVLDMGRARPGFKIIKDVTRQRLTYRRLLMGADLLSAQWLSRIGPTEGERIGVLLPNVNATPVTILSLWAARKVPAILNFSTGVATMVDCARLAELKHVITSRAFLERAKLDLTPFPKAGVNLIYLEDIRTGIPALAKISALLRHRLRVGSGIKEPRPGTAVVLFTSGSEGAPKGVELTHQNVLANLRQMLAVIDLQDSDSMFNALPMFHSFGLTVGTFLPLARGIPVFVYPSPLHYRIVPELVYENASTIMLGTNTFLNGYARRAHPYDFRSVRFLFAGAEKLQTTTADLWARRFGVRILEGYGATECSPCISANTPLRPQFGSAGRLLPRIEYRLQPVEGVAHGGRLLVRGPNVMKGYLNADANAKFLQLGGWYDTGDIVEVDEDGYVHILGRLKRFAKISGEMVSLTAVEEVLTSSLAGYGPRFEIAVASRPDEEKGERLIAVSNEAKLTLDEIRAAVRNAGLPNFAAPRELRWVKTLPKLGAGKINYRELQQIVDQAPEEAVPEDGAS
jgi:acyl-[acyl-carrier-protein]-phospholipid O-acyltransferase / long-chain-fatty-acid--[acyl-carrier-protein] ligase